MKYLEFKTLKDIDGIEMTFASEEVLKKDWDRP